MNKPVILLLLCMLFVLNACQSSFQSKTTSHSGNDYLIYRKNTSHKIIIDGKIDKAWNKATVLSDFKSPWDSLAANDETIFRALHDEAFLYFSFKIIDGDLFLTKERKFAEKQVLLSDRVELFLASPSGDYYSFEIDAAARLFDSTAKIGKIIDADWSIPSKDIQVGASINESGYFVEGKLSKEWMKSKKLILEDGTIQIGVFRADFNKDGTKVKWISWQTPESETPNFHLESAFGRMRLYKR